MMNSPRPSGRAATRTRHQLRSNWPIDVLGAARSPETLFVEKNQSRAQQHGPGRPTTPQTEHVLLCRPSADQLSLYKSILESDDVRIALERRGERHHGGSPAFRATLPSCVQSPRHLRRCGRGVLPRVLLIDQQSCERSMRSYGDGNNKSIRALVFSQSVKMLDILEALHSNEAMRTRGWTARHHPRNDKPRRTPLTYLAQRLFVCYLPHEPGGCGFESHKGRSRGLYDPDWNPQTDAQAKERWLAHRADETGDGL